MGTTVVFLQPGAGTPSVHSLPNLAKIERDTVRDTKLGYPATLTTLLCHPL